MSNYAPPPMTAQPVYLPAPRTSIAAVVSLICGILGCLFVTPFIAVICGIVGIAATRKPGVTGRGLAIAGLILGIIWIGIGIAGAAGGLLVYRNSEAPAQVARQFTADLVAGDMAAAQKTSSMAPADIQSLADAIKPLGTMSDLTLSSRNVDATNGKTRWKLAGTATFATGGAKVVAYELQPTSTGYDVTDATIK